MAASPRAPARRCVEDIVYDRDSGQLLTGSLMDYAVPRAEMMPNISVDFSPVASKSNPLGVKGVGEGGTVASTPDGHERDRRCAAALWASPTSPMPATPERVWRAIHDGSRAAK